MRKFISIVLLTAVTLTFQNCSESSHSDAGASSLGAIDFFEYPYSTAPKFFTDIQLFKLTTAPAELNNFTFIATIAHADPSTALISYQVRLLKADGSALCPTQTGTLSTGFTRVMFDCVSLATNDSVRAEVRVTSGGITETVQRIY